MKNYTYVFKFLSKTNPRYFLLNDFFFLNNRKKNDEVA
jgi:hypothetical protein